MRTKSISQLVMLILLLTTLMLSPVAYAQDTSAATGEGGGGGTVCPTIGMPDCEDGSNIVEKYDENNCPYYECLASDQDLPDFVFENGLSISSGPYYVGEKIKVSFNLLNRGSGSYSGPVTYIYKDQADGYSYFDSESTCTASTYLDKDESCLSSYYFEFSTPGTKTLSVTIDDDNEIDESNEFNNYDSISFEVVSDSDSCYDSDGGVYPYTQGTCTDSRGITVTDKCLSESGSSSGDEGSYIAEAFCLTDAMIEHCKISNSDTYCDNLPRNCYMASLIPNKNLAWTYFDYDEALFCPNGCEDGACKQGTEACVFPAGTSCEEAYACPGSDTIRIGLKNEMGRDIEITTVAVGAREDTQVWCSPHSDITIPLKVANGKEFDVVLTCKGLEEGDLFHADIDLRYYSTSQGYEHTVVGELKIIADDPIGYCSLEDDCYDSDGGRDYYERGKTKVCSSTAEEPGGSAVGCALHEDYCSDDYTLVEHYCEGNEYKSEFYTCPVGCMEGACVKELSCGEEGDMCSGIAGVPCCAGYTCQMDGTYPDASGTCVKETPKEKRFRNAYWECYDGEESYEGGPTSCKSSETWQEYAEEFCEGHCEEYTDAVEGATQKCGVNTFKVWNPCYDEIECSHDLEKEECEAAGGTYDPCPPCIAPPGVACAAVCMPICICESNVVYCEDEPYNSDCVCREGERTIVYEEPACEEGERCPLMAVRIKYECVTKEYTIKARLDEPFELETPQTAVIVDYNDMHVKLTAISSGKRYIGPPVPVETTETTTASITGDVVEEEETTETTETESESVISSEIMPPIPDNEYVAHLVITMPGSNKLVKARENVRAAIASITGRVAASSAGGGGRGAVAKSIATTASGGGTATATATSTGAIIAPSGAKVIKLRQGESAEVFGATITVRKLDKEHGAFVVSKKEIISCPEYVTCDDGTIKPCYQEGNECVCEACEETVCIPTTICPNGEEVDCKWDGDNCICEVCPTEEEPVCGNGICEEGEGMVCQSTGYSDLHTTEEVCYIACPEDCSPQNVEDCDGCVSGTRCLPYGSRRLIEDTAVYCDFEGAWQGQLEEGEACQNSYECETNTCTSGKCLDLEAQLAETQSLLRKILDWLKRLFGGED